MAVESRAVVYCVRCELPIPIEHPEKVTEEFSVRCPNCGHRALYKIKDIKTRQS